ncbi:DUF1015 family protein [Embleya sp. NPDC008237]|uniref:DUF1015 family protein n=1 Tax=Embleya sp. NPDC008237 TaxID=3363978 RepID=UPI0036F0B1AE
MDDAVPNGLDLAPFRGLRYDPERVGDVASVTSPPYDVVEPGGVPALEDADPHNIVRLVLPRSAVHAGSTLRTWLAEGALRPDPLPSLYVYEQRDHNSIQRGLIGALSLDSAVLPHEDVMPGPVADRAALMSELSANPEPILLVYTGGGRASDIVEQTTHQPPLVGLRTPDGIRHRLWGLTDRHALAGIRADLAHRKALIADGHHRWAAYARMRERAHADGRGDGPWDRGLVLLVDTVRHPLRVGAIHRVLPKLRPADALDALATYGDAGAGAFLARPLDGTLPAALWALDQAVGPAFLLVGDRRFHLLTGPDPDLLDIAIRADRPRTWRCLDATVLHAALLDHVWHVPDNWDNITYVHDAAAAVRQANQTGGTAILLRPTDERVVRELAEQDVRMPRKSTSFGPKPATGLVLRSLDLQE